MLSEHTIACQRLFEIHDRTMHGVAVQLRRANGTIVASGERLRQSGKTFDQPRFHAIRSTNETSMTSYRYYFLNGRDHVIGTGLLECDGDSEVRSRAERLLAGGDEAAIEVWEGTRQVHYAKR